MDSYTCIIFWRLFPTRIYVKFKFKLKDSLTLVKILEKPSVLNMYLITTDFESLHTNILVKDAIEIMKKRVFMFLNIITNAHFRIDLWDIILKKYSRVF